MRCNPGRWNNTMDLFDNAMKSQEPYPFDFNKAWVMLGFSKRNNAKVSLLNICEENKDFILLTNQQTGGILDQKQGNYEIIKLSADGFLKWWPELNCLNISPIVINIYLSPN
jgi:hypothetical protein